MSEYPIEDAPAESRPVQLLVSGLAGPVCTVDASTDWTILQVQEVICEQTSVPVNWQTLLKGTQKLRWEATVGSLLVDGLIETQHLTLVVQEVEELVPDALVRALMSRQRKRALRVLRRPQLPCLNHVGLYDRQGIMILDWTTLHAAVFMGCADVASAILARPDFTMINARVLSIDEFNGQTALHGAADQGLLSVCRAILAQADFTELLTRDAENLTASQRARASGHVAVADFLEEAEAQLRGEGH